MKKSLIVLGLMLVVGVPVYGLAHEDDEFATRREEFVHHMQERRAAAKERWEAARERLKAKLATIDDEQKQAVVERINLRLEELNNRVLNHYTNVLAKLELVLERIGKRADQAEAKGLDVSSVREAIGEAEDAIAESRDAITAQTSKVYTIVISGEETLKVDVGKTRQALHNDLKAVRATVKAAHNAVRVAAVTLAQIPKGHLDTSTTTPTTTP